MTPAREQTFDRVAWSWVDHVRGGGTTPWMQWVRSSQSQAADSSVPAVILPGAAQIEFVRRLAFRRETVSQRDDFENLADVVLGRSGPGRGLGLLPLIWPGSGTDGRRPHGAPPVDPSRVPVQELVRVGVGSLADLLLSGTQGGGQPVPIAGTARRRPWSKQFHLAGAPTTVADVRTSLAAAGSVEGGRRPEVLVFARPFDELMGQVWSARVQRGAPVRWSTFMTKWADKDVLPPSAALSVIAGHWAERVGPGRVHIVVGPDDSTGDRPDRRTASDVLGLRVAEPLAPPDVDTLSAAGVELVRTVSVVLKVRADPDRRRAALRVLASLIHDERGPGIAIPTGQHDWARARSEEIAQELHAGGYAVHGDLSQIVLRHSGETIDHPARRDVLDLAMDACLDAFLEAPGQR